MTRLPRMLNVADVADLCGVSVKTVRRWIDSGQLIVHRLGRQLRIAEADLAAFLALRRQAAWPQTDDRP